MGGPHAALWVVRMPEVHLLSKALHLFLCSYVMSVETLEQSLDEAKKVLIRLILAVDTASDATADLCADAS